ncbi:GGDEF domain-containing protein [Curvibacter sp. APW13]|uniref:GGDEF domain-containing protein n=1 Tax=Curvibacter sp. APW13 TaxID=3077236 RepID=UPI0028DE96FA|nr:GGDEF domain-containing protein [Curvibacter sp. APW13]MDT8989986.1 GGDEF domain-containing protein [Curvibacter sp. APW13]
MNLDVTSLLVINIVNLTVTATTLPFVMGRELSPAARHARTALIMQALGWIAMVASEQFVGHWLDRLLSVASIAFMGAGNWRMWCALRGWLGPRPFARTLMVLCVATPVGYFLSFDSYPVRVGWTNALLALQLLVVARACLLPRSTAQSGHWRWVLFACMVVMAGFTAARGVMGAFFTALYPSFTAPHPINVMAMVATNVALVLGNVAVLVAWRSEAEAQLDALAHTDALSGLLNRRGWEAQGGTLWANHERSQSDMALLMMDLDRFKRINDEAGHDVGDHVIRAFSEVLQGNVRRGDVAARIGGEEFAVLMPGADEAAARSLDARLRAGLRERNIPGLSFRPDFSTGLAVANPHDHNLEALLGRADAALYNAKSLGRGRLEMAVFRSNLSHTYGSSTL